MKLEEFTKNLSEDEIRKIVCHMEIGYVDYERISPTFDFELKKLMLKHLVSSVKANFNSFSLLEFGLSKTQ